MTIKIDGNYHFHGKFNNKIILETTSTQIKRLNYQIIITIQTIKIIKFSFNTSTQIYTNNEIIKFNYLKKFVSTSPILETTHSFHTYKY